MLSSCFLRCTQAAEDDDDEVMYSNDGIQSTFKKRTWSGLLSLLSGFSSASLLAIATADQKSENIASSSEISK
jgi:hypothetical protein